MDLLVEPPTAPELPGPSRPLAQFGLLGPVEMRATGNPVQLPGLLQQVLLTVLLLHPGKVVARAELMIELWPTRPPRRAGNALHAHVMRLRRQLARVEASGCRVPLVTRNSGYLLDVDGGQIDANQFRQLRRRAETVRHREPAAAAQLLRQALGLWRGAALQDVQRGPQCRAAAASLDEARLQVEEQLIELHLQQHRAEETIDHTLALTTLYPMRESLHRHLMTALYLCGRRAEALAVYQDLRHRFVEQLGTEPSPLLQRRHAAILRGDRLDGGSATADQQQPDPGRQQ